MTLESIKILSREGVQTVKHRSAMTSLLLVCAAVSTPCFVIAAETGNDVLRWLMAVTGFLPVAVFVFAFLYLLFTDPDRLQSEEYQLRDRALDILQTKGGPITLTADLEKILNPYDPSRALPGSEGGVK